MRHRTHLAGLLALLVLAAPAVAGEELVGAPTPTPTIDKWLLAPDGATLEDLRGHVVLVLAPGTVDLADERQVLRWSDLRAAHHERGLRVLALLAKEPTPLPPTLDFSAAVGSCAACVHGGAPCAVLVGADGKVAWAGRPDDVEEATIVALLRKAKPFSLPPLDECLKDAVAAFRKGRLAEARDLAKAVEHADAARLLGRIASIERYWRERRERAAAQSNVADVVHYLGLVEKHLPGSPEAAEAAPLRADLEKKHPKELSAATGYARLRTDLARAQGKRKKLEALVKKAERFAERHAGTVGGARAGRLAEALREDPVARAVRAFVASEKVKTDGGSWRTSLPKPPILPFAKDRAYLWHLETSHGAIHLRFRPDVAPMHVSSAIYLTELGFFDGLTFHRVIPGFMAQGGCPLGSGRGDPGYAFDGEFDPKAKHDKPGILSAANSGPGTDGSQFFITFGPAGHLDGKHTVYGEVVKGEDALKRIEKDGTSGGSPMKKIVIEKATWSVE